MINCGCWCGKILMPFEVDDLTRYDMRRNIVKRCVFPNTVRSKTVNTDVVGCAQRANCGRGCDVIKSVDAQDSPGRICSGFCSRNNVTAFECWNGLNDKSRSASVCNSCTTSNNTEHNVTVTHANIITVCVNIS